MNHNFSPNFYCHLLHFLAFPCLSNPSRFAFNPSDIFPFWLHRKSNTSLIPALLLFIFLFLSSGGF